MRSSSALPRRSAPTKRPCKAGSRNDRALIGKRVGGMPLPMRYVRRVLQPNETVVHATRLHWRIYVRCALLLVVCAGLAVAAMSFASAQPNVDLGLRIAAGIFLLLALSAGLHEFVRRATTEFAITNHRVIYK